MQVSSVLQQDVAILTELPLSSMLTYRTKAGVVH